MFCVSWPIPYKNPQRKLFFNTGFQFNYGEPFSPSSFYNATYYQNILDGRHHVDDNFLSTEIFANATKSTNDMQSARFVERSVDSEQSDLTGSDLTASQLYKIIEDNIRV